MSEPTLSETHVAGPGTRITLEFALKLASGDLVDRTPPDVPATFTWGDGNLPECFEARLAGLAPGAFDRFEIAAADAFGPWREENVQRQARTSFDAGVQLDPGTVVHFEDASGSGLAGVVRGVCERWVDVDFNHPLAGRDLLFEVAIVAVEPLPDATETLANASEQN